MPMVILDIISVIYVLAVRSSDIRYILPRLYVYTGNVSIPSGNCI